MNKQHELELWEKWKNTGESQYKRDLIKSMKPLLVSQANKYAGSGLPKESIETEANRLAIEAFKTYDPKKSALNTHTVNHLKHLQRYVINYQNVGRIPENRALQLSRFQSVKRHLMDDLGREPSSVELADKLQWNTREVERMESEIRNDLSMISGKDEDFFEDLLFNTDEKEDAFQFVYYEQSPEDKLLMEYIFGKGGKPQIGLDFGKLSMKTGRPEHQLRKKVKELAERIEYVRGLSGI
jgi:DNA-directed RNA polymerase sigma subunit (sigma70/sigma32)